MSLKSEVIRFGTYQPKTFTRDMGVFKSKRWAFQNSANDVCCGIWAPYLRPDPSGTSAPGPNYPRRRGKKIPRIENRGGKYVLKVSLIAK